MLEDEDEEYSVYKLGKGEIFWRDHCDWLKEEGYLLRPRYQKDWVASYKSVVESYSTEDGQLWLRSTLVDATVAADGSFVAMKRIRADTEFQELDIATYFSAEPLRSDPANHCVPVLRVLSPPNEPQWKIIVMPLLRKYYSPRFDTVGEAVEFFRQLFEGLQFMHKHNVAHRDCGYTNIMMDGGPLYNIPWHPIKHDRKRDWSGKLKASATRTQHPVKYYLVDFGFSKRYPTRPVLEPVEVNAGDKSAPEYKTGGPCDPFKTDVYLVGNIIKREYLPGGSYAFMRKLIDDMTQDDPASRPDADEVVRRFDELLGGLSTWKLRSRAVKPKEIFTFSFAHWQRRIKYLANGVAPLPKP